MIFLPIVERELRVRARLRSTYRLRIGIACVAFLLVFLLLVMGGRRSTMGRPGTFVFHALAWGAFAFCLLEGARNTSDSLSEEKRAGTLGLLFLTDLRPYDVVLGKLMATSVNSFYGLLAIFPPMAIPLLIGGVTFDEFWRLVLVLLNAMVFSLTFGLAVSAGARDDRSAWSIAMASVLAWAILPPLLLLSPAWSTSIAAALSPTTAFLTAFDARYAVMAGVYWHSVLWVHVSSWLFLAAAAFLLPRNWQDRPIERRAPWWRRWFTPRAGPSVQEPVAGLRRRAMILDGNPAVWLVVRGQARLTALWVIVVLASLCAVSAWILTSGAKWTGVSILAVMLLIHFVVATWVGIEACHLLSGSRDALEILLCTPLPAKLVVEGHLEGLRQRFFRPVATLLTVELLLLAAQVYVLGVGGTSMAVCFGILIVVGLSLAGSLLDLVAVARFGLWQGLANRKPSKAVTKTLIYVLVIPFAGTLLMSGGLLLPIVSLVKNLMVINYAQERMRRQFRALVTDRYGWAEEEDLVNRPSQVRPRPVNPLPPVWPG